MLQQPQVGREFGGGCRDPGEHGQDLRVELAGVRLPRHGEDPRKLELARHAQVEVAHLLIVSVEQLEEARLRAGGALHAPELKRIETVQQLFGVEQELLHPERDPLAHRGELRGLEVRVGEAGQGAVAPRQVPQRDEHRCDAAQQQAQPLPHQHEVGVVGDVRAGGAEVEEGPRGGSLLAEVMDVRHHVMAQPLLMLGGALQVHVVQVGAQLRERLIGNVEAELLLRLHQREPQAPPQPDAPPLAPQRLHRRRGVALRQGRVVGHGVLASA